MTEYRNKPYDLEARTLQFARGVVRLCHTIPKDVVTTRIIGQLVNAAGSVGANYREANEAVSKKDFVHRMRISRKECKESGYWLELLKDGNQNVWGQIESFIKESQELRNIFTSIIEKSK